MSGMLWGPRGKVTCNSHPDHTDVPGGLGSSGKALRVTAASISVGG